MLDFITRLVQPIVRIKREEWRKTILLFLYFFITITTLYILKPIRNSEYVNAYGADMLHFAYMGEVLFLFGIVYAYDRLSRLIRRKNVLLSTTLLFFIVTSMIFWLFFRLGMSKWVAFIFYVWFASYSITVVTQFWMLANDIFTAQDARRLFGFIASGGGLGGMLGGWITQETVMFLGTENLLFFVVICLTLCLICVNLIWKYEKLDAEKIEPEEIKPLPRKERLSPALRDRGTWRVFLSSRYLLMITAVIIIAKVAATIVDNQFNAVVELNIAGKDLRTKFYGNFFYYMNLAAFLMQLVVASRVLRYFGVGIPLFLLPLGLVFGAGLVSFVPVLIFASAAKIYDGAMNYSVYKLGVELLYLPIPRQLRYRVKPIMDMLMYRGAKFIAGLIIFLVLTFLSVQVHQLGFIVVAIVPFWVYSIWEVRKGYLSSIRKLITRTEGEAKGRRIPAREAIEILTHLEGDRNFEKLKQLLMQQSSVARKLSATAFLALYSGVNDVSRVRRLTEEMLKYEALELKGIKIDHLFVEPRSKDSSYDRLLSEIIKARSDSSSIESLLQQKENEVLLNIAECLEDPECDVSKKRKAILILETLKTDTAIDVLMHSLAAAKDHSLRFNLIRAMNRIKARTERRVFNKLIIKREVAKEISNHRHIDVLMREYQRRKKHARTEDDYVLATLQAVREESFERIFRLLALVYESDLIHAIHERLLDASKDMLVRANIMELLQNITEPDVYQMLVSLIEEDSVGHHSDEAFAKTITYFAEGKDPWLSICALIVTAELRFSRMYSMLDAMRSSPNPMIRETAQMGLIKTGA